MLNGYLLARNGWGMEHIGTNGANDSSHVQQLSNGSECGVQNGKREKSGDRSQETEWGAEAVKTFCIDMSRMSVKGVQNGEIEF